MKTVEIEVKSKGEMLGVVDCNVYESMDEAKADGVTDEYVLAAINRCVRKDARDTFYANATQQVTPVGQARKLAKEDEGFAAELAKLVSKYNK
jgi:hypothetical protein